MAAASAGFVVAAVLAAAALVAWLLGHGPMGDALDGAAATLALAASAVAIAATAGARLARRAEANGLGRLIGFVDTAPLPALLVDRSGRLVHANVRLTTMVGHCGTAVLNDWVEPALIERLMADPARLEARVHALPLVDAEPLWVETCLTRVEADGRPYVMGWSRDVTDRKAAEDALRDSERRLRALIDDSPVAVVVARPSGRILHANPKAAAMLGLPRALLIGADARDFHVDAEQREQVGSVLREGGAVHNAEIDLKTADGRRRAALLTAQPLDFDGSPAWLAWIVDITPRKEAEEALARHRDQLADRVTEATAELERVNVRLVQELEDSSRSRTYLRTVLDTVADGIVAIDTEGTIEDFNPAAERIFGYARHEVLGQNIAILMPPAEAPHHGDRVRAYLDRADLSAVGKGREVMARRRDGAAVPVHIAVKAAQVGGHTVLTGVIRDVTAEKAAARALIAAKDEAQLANRAKTEFLANMGHELRTPLNAIIGFSEMMKDELLGPMPDSYRSYAEAIGESGTRLLAVINDVLDLSRIETGRMTLCEGDLAVSPTLLAVAEVMAPRFRDAELTLHMEVEDALPVLRADVARFKQMLLHLLSNAVKFSHHGGTVDLSAHRRTAEAGGGLEIVVTDHGIGMRPEDVESALRPFVQVDGGLARRYEGTGLGLPLTLAMIELHDGTLSLDSEPGRGTRATLWFPPGRLHAGPILHSE